MTKQRRARVMSWVWWAQLPVVTIGYWLVSSQPWIEKMWAVYLADVSIIAIAVSYAGKAHAAESNEGRDAIERPAGKRRPLDNG